MFKRDKALQGDAGIRRAGARPAKKHGVDKDGSQERKSAFRTRRSFLPPNSEFQTTTTNPHRGTKRPPPLKRGNHNLAGCAFLSRDTLSPTGIVRKTVPRHRQSLCKRRDHKCAEPESTMGPGANLKKDISSVGGGGGVADEKREWPKRRLSKIAHCAG